MKTKSLIFLSFIFIICNQLFAQDVQSEQKRIERLAGLAKVWGTVKFFHPFPAYKDIDWDRALIETIPLVNAAKNSEEYKSAVNHLLSFLNDKNTFAENPSKANAERTARNAGNRELVRLENGVLIVVLGQIARESVKDNGKYRENILKIEQNYPQSKAVIIDLRISAYEPNEDPETIELFANELFRDALAKILDKNVTLGTIRYRMHNGYEPQTGNSTGGYYSGFIIDTPNEIVGQNKNKTVPIAAIINDNSPSIISILSALQAINAAFVVHEGDLTKEPGVPTYTINLPDNTKVKMRTAEVVNADGSLGFQPDLVNPESINEKDAAMAEVVKIINQNSFKHTHKNTTVDVPMRNFKDKPYAEMEYPNAEYRLLALFRFWNVINYFYPYKDLIGEDWENILPRYIPKFEADKSSSDYNNTVQELMAETKDSHTLIRAISFNPKEVKNPRFYPPLTVKYIENQTVVSNVFDENTGVKKGETITAINGIPVQKYGEEFAKRISASTPQSLQQRLHYAILGGDENSKIRLTLRDLEGNIHEIQLTRNVAFYDPKLLNALRPPKTAPVFGVLPGGFGYVDLTRLQVSEVDKMFEALNNTPAVIFDMRGYPKATAWSIAPRLTNKIDVPAALISRPFLTATALGRPGDLRNQSFTFTQNLPLRQGNIYQGKVVMLINEDAISQSEHTALFFEAATKVTFVGMPTTGADGDVTTMVLPGNLSINFTGHNIRHADGRQLQRVGIQPHIKVAPTIRGMLEGRDEILDVAIKFLQTSVN